MKLILKLLSFLSIMGCSMHHYPNQSFYDTKGQFYDYDSYAVISNNALSPKDRFSIEKGIMLHMNSLGYQIDLKKPSIYIYYQVYTKNFKLEAKDQAPFENWVTRQHFFPAGDKPKDQQSSVTKVHGPSFFISFYDPALQKEVWKGYVSNVNINNPSKRQAAVQIVLEQYRLMAQKPNRDLKHFASY